MRREPEELGGGGLIDGSGGVDDGRQRPAFTPRQRLALFRRVLVPDVALQIDASEITFTFLKQNGVTAANVRAAKLTALDLKAIGLASALELRELDFDALDLCNASFCASAVAAFGAADVTRSFLLDAGDAVALAGSIAVHHLQLTTQRLLEACAGSPEQAKAVLQQTDPHGGALSGCKATVLLDTGLRATTLCSLGYFLDRVMEQTVASRDQATKLGFL